jgi:hypothetical protein
MDGNLFVTILVPIKEGCLFVLFGDAPAPPPPPQTMGTPSIVLHKKSL